VDYHKPHLSHPIGRIGLRIFQQKWTPIWVMLYFLLSGPCRAEQQVPIEHQAPIVEDKQYRIHLAPEFLVTAPQPLLLGLEAFYERLPEIKFFFDGGYVQFPFSIESKGIKELTLETGIRYSPFQNWFRFGLGLGYRKIGFFTNISAFQIDGETLATGAQLNLSTFYLSPMIEALFQVSEHVDIGFGLGLQIPLFYSGTMNLENQNNGNNSSNTDVLSVDSLGSMTRIAGLVLPRLTLFHLVWRFE
jgi:hypothetical protein